MVFLCGLICCLLFFLRLKNVFTKLQKRDLFGFGYRHMFILGFVDKGIDYINSRLDYVVCT